MRCKDCIHFKRCVVLGVELDMQHSNNADKNCRHFNSKADFMVIRHGEWINKLVAHGNVAEMKSVCSLCNKPNKQYQPPYCPHCGAKMDR